MKAFLTRYMAETQQDTLDMRGPHAKPDMIEEGEMGARTLALTCA